MHGIFMLSFIFFVGATIFFISLLLMFPLAGFSIFPILKYSGLTIPALNNKELLPLVGCFVLPYIWFVNKKSGQQHNIQYMKMMYAFMFIIVVTIFYRGIGLGILNKTQSGGSFYFNLISCFLFWKCCTVVNIDARKVIRVIILMMAIAFLSTVIYLLIDLKMISNPPFFLITREVSAYSSFGVARIFSMSNFALYGFLMFLTIYAVRLKGKIGYLCISIILVLFFIIGTYSGHRIIGVQLLLMGIIYFLIDKNFKKGKKTFLVGGGGLIGIILLYLIVNHIQSLPLVMQRSLSFLPGIENKDALGTSEWRIFVWMLALKHELPQYWLMGRGFSIGAEFNPNIFGVSNHFLSSLDSFNYHNGPITAAICFGIPGLILFSLIIVMSFIRFQSYLNKIWSSFQLYNIFKVVYMWYISTIILFFVVYGDATMMAQLVFLIAMLELLIQTDERTAVIR